MAELELSELVDQVARLVAARLGRAEPVGFDPWDPPFIVAGNWKMNPPKGEPSDVAALLDLYVSRMAACPVSAVRSVVFPPSVLLSDLARAARHAGWRAEFGVQDLHPEPSGAHTGETSADLARMASATWALVGHSERRAAGEDDGLVASKLKAALRGGLSAMLCVGETEAERNRGVTFQVLRRQVMAALSGLALESLPPGRLAIAYEPVWAIGTGKNATASDIAEASAFIRTVAAEQLGPAWAARMRILYGGSLKPANAHELLQLADVDGGLVGGASLDVRSFSAIIRAAADCAAGD